MGPSMAHNSDMNRSEAKDTGTTITDTSNGSISVPSDSQADSHLLLPPFQGSGIPSRLSLLTWRDISQAVSQGKHRILPLTNDQNPTQGCKWQLLPFNPYSESLNKVSLSASQGDPCWDELKDKYDLDEDAQSIRIDEEIKVIYDGDYYENTFTSRQGEILDTSTQWFWHNIREQGVKTSYSTAYSERTDDGKIRTVKEESWDLPDVIVIAKWATPRDASSRCAFKVKIHSTITQESDDLAKQGEWEFLQRVDDRDKEGDENSDASTISLTEVGGGAEESHYPVSLCRSVEDGFTEVGLKRA